MSLDLEVDLGAGVPPFEQIRAQVLAHVAAGRLRAGDRLPTIRALANDLGVAAGTVARAYRELEAGGVVTTRRRTGTVVAAGQGATDDAVARAAQDPDTWSAGSFFTNPVVTLEQAESLPTGAPRFPVRTSHPERTTGPSLGAVDPSVVKTSAAWLIERAGFGRGFGQPGGISVSTKHSLALTNRGHGTTAELVVLARTIRDGVQAAFGITLEPEPVLVGVHL